MRPLVHLAVTLALAVALVGVCAADPPELKIIVHPDNPTTAVDRGFVRGAFLKRRRTWKDDRAIRPIDFGPLREQFARSILGKTPAQLRDYWNQQIFSGKGIPPPSADSVEAVIAYVLANAGAIAYIPAAADPKQARVVTLE